MSYQSNVERAIEGYDSLKELMWLHDEVAKCLLLLDMTKFTLPEALSEIKRAHRESTLRLMNRPAAAPAETSLPPITKARKCHKEIHVGAILVYCDLPREHEGECRIPSITNAPQVPEPYSCENSSDWPINVPQMFVPPAEDEKRSVPSEVLEFLAALAKATEYKSHPLGFADSLDHHWKEEAAELLTKLAAEAPASQPQMGTCDLVSRPHPQECCGEAWKPLPSAAQHGNEGETKV